MKTSFGYFAGLILIGAVLRAQAQTPGSVPTPAAPGAAPPAAGVPAPPALPRGAARPVGRRHYWLDAEVGSSSMAPGGIALGFGVHAELRRRWLVTAGSRFEGGIFNFGSGQHDDASSYQVLGGKIFKGPAVLATVSAGVALVHIHTVNEDNSFLLPVVTSEEDHTTVGVPIQVQGYLVGLQTFGLGVVATLNLNPVKSSASLGLALAIGHLPTRRPPLE